MSTQNWFENWFNTHYYHLLYKHRSDEEAQAFLDHLLHYLKPIAGSKILDLACGKGRHSIYLNKQGLSVTGIDLSTANIEHAKQFENSTLNFEVADMRQSFGNNKYNYVFNLFTSFGYFENEIDDVKVLQNVFDALISKGIFVFDFLNSKQIQQSLCVRNFKKSIDGVDFVVSKVLENGYVVKHIEVYDGEKKQHFQEKVKAIDFEWFSSTLEQVGFTILDVFGNYRLDSFTDSSDRLIIVAQKK